jgi:putative transcriptional regulator
MVNIDMIIENDKNYQGMVLVSQPNTNNVFFKDTCVVIARHSEIGAWGVAINKPISATDYDLRDVFTYLKIQNPMGINSMLYAGGPVERNKICLIHTSDWSAESTLKVTEDISITPDSSILSALACGQGPAKFKVCCGLCVWRAGQLEGEMKGAYPWTPAHRWLSAPASIQGTFDVNDNHIWLNSLKAAVDIEVKEWF